LEFAGELVELVEDEEGFVSEGTSPVALDIKNSTAK